VQPSSGILPLRHTDLEVLGALGESKDGFNE
jgi:hypothetical protein